MHRHALASLLVIPVLALAACSDTKTPASTPTATATAATSTPAATTGTATAVAASATPARAKVSANNTSRAQLQAAFEAAGIASAARWAKEVEEYRPYPATEPDMPKLRKELAKYNPGPGVVDQIIATLSLP